MDNQPEALRLADALREWDGKMMMPPGWRDRADSELRRLHAENERLMAAADLVRAQALEDAARELDSDWPADTIEERSYRKQYAKLIRALKDTQ